MLKSISVRKSQGTQYIADLRTAQPAGFRSKPLIADTDCKIGCQECISACPSSAILVAPVQIDLGRCVLCGDCAPVCPSNKISFSNDVRLAATNRQALIVTNAHPNTGANSNEGENEEDDKFRIHKHLWKLGE